MYNVHTIGGLNGKMNEIWHLLLSFSQPSWEENMSDRVVEAERKVKKKKNIFSKYIVL